MEIYKGTAYLFRNSHRQDTVLQQRGIPDTSVSGQQHKKEISNFQEARLQAGSETS